MKNEYSKYKFNQADITKYRQEFINPLNFRERHIYKLNKTGAHWKHSDFPGVTNGMIVNHAIRYKYWLGLKAGHYINFGVIDQDGIGLKKLDELTGDLGFKEGQFKDYSSESYLIDGSSHRYFRPRLKDEPTSYYKYSDILRARIKSKGLELFPHTGLGLRLPFGKYQNLIDRESGEVLNLNLAQNLDVMQSIEDYPLESIDPEPELDLKFYKSHSPVSSSARVQEILDHGIQSFGTRRNLTKDLIIGKYRENYDPRITRSQVKHWIKTMHNGMSHTVNDAIRTRNWKAIYKEIDDLITWTYNTFNRSAYYPDSTNNLEGGILESDNKFIAGIFPGSLPNQRKFFNLICYLRTRARINHNEAGIKIHSTRWIKIAGRRRYQLFQNQLMDKRINGKPILIKGTGYTVQSQYAIGESKRYTINGLEPGGEFLALDRRNITTWADMINNTSIDILKFQFKINLANRWNLDYLRKNGINLLKP